MFTQIIGLIGLFEIGVLDEVGPHHLKNMYIMGGKTEGADHT